MKKNGIVSKKTNKRDAGSFLLFVFLLPYLAACLWGHAGEETGRFQAEKADGGQQEAHMIEADVEWGVWELPLEEYLSYRLFQVMPGEYEKEALKAQAVLLRTELAVQFQEGERITADSSGLSRFYAAGDGMTEALAAYREAVAETAGEILTYHGGPIRASYFRVSNGSTRKAGEEYPYLCMVSCKEDQSSPDYNSVVTVEKEVYIAKLASAMGEGIDRETLWENPDFSYDAAGYMTGVSYFAENGEEKKTDGETFRHLFGLPSASFQMDREEGRIIFSVTGVGHGFGMSQYAADCRAKDGETYKEILAEFFFDTELAIFE